MTKNMNDEPSINDIDREEYEEMMRKLKIDSTEYFMNNDRTRCMLTHTKCEEPDCRSCQFAFGQTLRIVLKEIFPECIGEIEDS
jgi:hypothetical protein